MGPRQCRGSAATTMFIGLAFFVGGLITLIFAPHRSLVCQHPERPQSAACMALELSDDSERAAPDCPLAADIQCRLEARIIGLIPSHDQRLAGIRDFGLLEKKVNSSANNKAHAGVELTLLFVTEQGSVDLGWHAKAFATRKRHASLQAFARQPSAFRTDFAEKRMLPLVIGFVMLGLGLMTILSGFAARR